MTSPWEITVGTEERRYTIFITKPHRIGTADIQPMRIVNTGTSEKDLRLRLEWPCLPTLVPASTTLGES